MKPLTIFTALACTVAGLLGWILAPHVGHAGPDNDPTLRVFTTDTGVIARLIYDTDAPNPLETYGPGVAVSGPKGLDGDTSTYARYTAYTAKINEVNARQYAGELSPDEAKKARASLGPNRVSHYVDTPRDLDEQQYELWLDQGAAPGLDPYQILNAYARYDQHAVFGLDITYPDGSTKEVRGIYMGVDSTNFEYFL